MTTGGESTLGGRYKIAVILQKKGFLSLFLSLFVCLAKNSPKKRLKNISIAISKFFGDQLPVTIIYTYINHSRRLATCHTRGSLAPFSKLNFISLLLLLLFLHFARRNDVVNILSMHFFMFTF